MCLLLIKNELRFNVNIITVCIKSFRSTRFIGNDINPLKSNTSGFYLHIIFKWILFCARMNIQMLGHNGKRIPL